MREDSKATQAIFRTGHEVGAIARHLYDPAGEGALIDLHAEGIDPAIARTKNLLFGDKPIFEAGFAAEGALAFTDVLLPQWQDGSKGWRMVEVKSSTSVKNYHRDDIAIQSFVARESGLALTGVALAHIDTGWTYPGNGDYRGLLVEKDLTEVSLARSDGVRVWIVAAHAVVANASAPEILVGPQCNEPFSCGFIGHCAKGLQSPAFPVSWLPRIQAKALKSHIDDHAVTDMRDIPDWLLTEVQRRVRTHTISGESFFDGDGAERDLAAYPPPAYFLDFETIQFGVPRWQGTRPFESLPFQFSRHYLDAQGRLSHQAFLDLTGENPTRRFAEALISACGTSGPIFVYNAGFESACIRGLARRFADLQYHLMAMSRRLVDLLPIAQARYYHPGQQGSWSIKKVLPAVAPSMRYDALAGIQDGRMARDAYLEATEPATSTERIEAIDRELRVYCELDTMAMVKIWAGFAGTHTNLLNDQILPQALVNK